MRNRWASPNKGVITQSTLRKQMDSKNGLNDEIESDQDFVIMPVATS
jgi:hypothetical protein